MPSVNGVSPELRAATMPWYKRYARTARRELQRPIKGLRYVEVGAITIAILLLVAYLFRNGCAGAAGPG